MRWSTIRKEWLFAGALLVGCGGGAPGESPGSIFEELQQCASQTVEGVDVYQGQGSINWTAVKGAGIAFAMIKATQGTSNTQSTFAYNWSNAKTAGLYRSAYHFFDPTEDGIAQAHHYLMVVGALAPDDLPPMLDIECPDGSPTCLGNGASGATPAATIHQRMWDWIHTVETATGKTPLVYSYGSYFSSNAIDTTGLGAYPLFIAYPTAAMCFSVPAPWSKAAIWQYSWTGTVSGISGQVDRDRFIGTIADLHAFALGNGSDGGVATQPSDGGTGTRDAGSDGFTSPPESGADGFVTIGAEADATGGDAATRSRDAGMSGNDTGGCGCKAAGGSREGPGSFAIAAAFLLGAGAALRRRVLCSFPQRDSKGQTDCPMQAVHTVVFGDEDGVRRFEGHGGERGDVGRRVEDDGHHGSEVGANELCHAVAVDCRHLEVENDGVRSKAANDGADADRRAGGHDLEALAT
jgi:MYXO-CTERM domain-containing protein